MTDPRPDLLKALPEEIAARVSEALPDLRTCKAQAGRFDLDALRKLGVAAPAVLVAVTRLAQSQTYAGPAPSFNVELAAFVITKDGMGLPRDAAAMTICQALLQLVPNRTWSLAGVGEAERVAALPLVTAAQDKLGASLWAVTWQQPISFDPLPASDPVAVELYVAQHPNVGPDHAGDYDQIGGTQ
ncbi:hypothetical protein [Thioclava sp.]|uniref:hypothetical protein n=1 Tax=Thioclava sp. TaxID=1933450 RepID=UPI0032426767